jgi:hypothetical protein
MSDALLSEAHTMSRSSAEDGALGCLGPRCNGRGAQDLMETRGVETTG